MGTHFSYAIIAVVSFMQGDYASLDLCGTLDQAKVARGFAAYEARQGGVVGNHKLKKWIFLPLMPRWQILLSAKVFKTLRAYPMQPYPQSKSQNTATTGLAHLKRCAYKINAAFSPQAFCCCTFFRCWI